jgi:hypothetical protein
LEEEEEKFFTKDKQVDKEIKRRNIQKDFSIQQRKFLSFTQGVSLEEIKEICEDENCPSEMCFEEEPPLGMDKYPIGLDIDMIDRTMNFDLDLI